MLRNERGGSKTDTVVKLVLIFFISLLSFSVGTFVGKQVSDSDYRRSALEEDYQSFRDTASVEEGNESEEENAISDSEIDSLTDKFVQVEKNKMAKEMAEKTKTAQTENKSKDEPKKSPAKTDKDGYKKYTKAEPSQQYKEKMAEKKDEEKAKQVAYKKMIAAKESAAKDKPKSAPDNKAVTQVASRVADGKAPVQDAPTKRKPTSILPGIANTTIGKYTVQVASYPTETEAKNHATNLKGKGWNAFYVKAVVNSRAWYRVSVGIFDDQKSAGDFRKKLMSQAKISSAIIQKISK